MSQPGDGVSPPGEITIHGVRSDEVQLAYGENRWQDDPPPAYYRLEGASDDPLALHRFEHLNPDKPGGVVNLLDLDRALQTVTHLAAGCLWDSRPRIAVAVKHGNPCGATMQAYYPPARQVVHGDPLSIFGGVLVCTFCIDRLFAEELLTFRCDGKRILAGIAAPGFSDDALGYLLKHGGRSCKLWQNLALSDPTLDTTPRFMSVRGGFIVQSNYTFVLDLNAPYIEVHGERGGYEVEQALVRAWAIGSTSNSNTITLVQNNGVLVGNGVGQQDRVGAAELAIKLARRSGHELSSSWITAGESETKTESHVVAYSDSFFPFPDGIEVLAAAGIKYVLASSGSIGDPAVISRAKELGVTLYLGPDKLIRGFACH